MSDWRQRLVNVALCLLNVNSSCSPEQLHKVMICLLFEASSATLMWPNITLISILQFVILCRSCTQN